MQKNNIFKLSIDLSKYALPICANSILNILASIVAMFFVAQLGKVELAAAALATSTFIAIVTLGSTCINALGILVSQAHGQDNKKEIAKIIANGLWSFIIIGVFISILLWNADKLLVLFDQNPKLIALTIGYFHGAALVTFPFFVSFILAQFYMGIGRPNFTLVISLIKTPLVIILSYGLILGKFGLPKLGLAGVNYSLFIVQTFSMLGNICYLSFSKFGKRYNLFSYLSNIDLSLCKKILSLGIPIGLQYSGEISAMTVATYFMGSFGVSALAASQIVSQYVIIVVMITMGFSQSLSLLISKHFQNNNNAHTMDYFAAAALPLGLCFLIFAFFFIVEPTPLLHLFLDVRHPANASILNLGKAFFLISFILLFIDAIRNLLGGALRGLHDSKSPMRIGVICLWLISLPAAYITAFWFHGGPIGLRWAFVSGFFVATVWLWFRLRHLLANKQQNIDVGCVSEA